VKLKKIRSNNGKEFDNINIEAYCDEVGFKHEVSITYTQQNGVVERKNRTLITLARTMLDEYNTPEALWAEAINTTCYAANRLFLQKFLGKTPYELLNGNKPDVSFRVFDYKCYIYKKRQHLGKFQRCDIGFLWFSCITRKVRCTRHGCDDSVGHERCYLISAISFSLICTISPSLKPFIQKYRVANDRLDGGGVGLNLLRFCEL
jgi:hypothetical protein